MCALVGFQFAQPPCGPRSFQLLSTPGQFGGNPRYGAAVTFAAVAASPAATECCRSLPSCRWLDTSYPWWMPSGDRRTRVALKIAELHQLCGFGRQSNVGHLLLLATGARII